MLRRIAAAAVALLSMLWWPATATANTDSGLATGFHELARGRVTAGVHSVSGPVRFSQSVCDGLLATHPELEGKPCIGRYDITITSALDGGAVASPTTAAPFPGTVTIDAVVCGPAWSWCFHDNAQWGFADDYSYTWTNWVDCSNWYVLGGSGGVDWCGSTGNYTYTSVAGVNAHLSFPWGSWGTGERTYMNANVTWSFQCWGNGGGQCGL